MNDNNNLNNWEKSVLEKLVFETVGKYENIKNPSLEEIFEIDKKIREELK